MPSRFDHATVAPPDRSLYSFEMPVVIAQRQGFNTEGMTAGFPALKIPWSIE
ncbi:hypothetical protein [Pandoraea sp.]|uniref:hypothetical protein n=1 Tax=Pandoraea sp. TaxID=1883445 RepID=UPI0025D0664E|nr:hypothetical protein [Pandoraea sp.]